MPVPRRQIVREPGRFKGRPQHPLNQDRSNTAEWLSSRP